MPSQQFKDYRRSFRGMLEQEREAGRVAVGRQQEYDPYAAAATSAQAQFQTFDRDLRRSLDDMRGSQVGTGRLRTGFGYQDQDRLWEGAVEGLNRSLAERALDASRLDLANITSQQQARSLAAEMAAGGMDQELQLEDIERAKKSGIGGFLGGALGGIGGFFLGGPLGAVAGSQIGSQAGAGIGGIFA